MNKLQRVKNNLIAWQQAHADKQHKCLLATRAACEKEGLHLPYNDPPKNTAFECFLDLKADPGKWHWVQWHRSQMTDPLPAFCLVFFGDCGKLDDGRVAGHIAIYEQATNTHYSNQNYPMTAFWAARLLGAFVPNDV